MSLSVLARSAPRHPFLRRAIHSTTAARSAHGEYHHLPFNFPGKNKISFGVKLTAFLTVGFSIPFIASAYQMKKSGGSD